MFGTKIAKSSFARCRVIANLLLFFPLKHPKLPRIASRLFFPEPLKAKAMLLCFLASQFVPVPLLGLAVGDAPQPVPVPALPRRQGHLIAQPQLGPGQLHGRGQRGHPEELQGQLSFAPLQTLGQTPSISSNCFV